MEGVRNEDSRVKEIAGDKFCNREEEYDNSCGYGYSLTPFEQLNVTTRAFHSSPFKPLLDFQKLTGHERTALRAFSLITGNPGFTSDHETALRTYTISGRSSGTIASWSFPGTALLIHSG